VRARPSSTVPTASDGDGFNYMVLTNRHGICYVSIDEISCLRDPEYCVCSQRSK